MDLQVLFLIILICLSIINILITLNRKQSSAKDNIDSIDQKLSKIDAEFTKIDKLMRDEFARNREEIQRSSKENRGELGNSFKLLGETLSQTVSRLSDNQKSQFEIFSNQLKEFEHGQKQKFEDLILKQESIKSGISILLTEIRETVENKLKTIQEENAKKLEEMRKTVDEKLQDSVEKRFNESFKVISERLEQVHKGLGEMQNLASGVGDLKKVLMNVKTRGNLGEIQLGAILEQVMSTEQYEQNAAVKKNSLERVEYAIKLPNKNDKGQALLLPIDSKFPMEDYQRLIEAYESNNDIEQVSKQFEASVKKSAKEIRDKYINPPVTTDFAIMFVPTEGLYAEILRKTGLFETLRRDYKIVVVGPTNLVAFLNSLQMGFRTLAIEKRSSEVWNLLGAVKTQFGKFGEVLDGVKKKLNEAVNKIDDAGQRSRVIERRLKKVEELPSEQATALIEESDESIPE